MAIDDANSKLDKIVTELQRMNRSIAGSFGSGSSGGHSAGSRVNDPRTNSSSKIITNTKREHDGKLTNKSLSWFRKEIKDVGSALNDFGTAVNRDRTHIHELYNSQTKLIKSLVSHDKVLNRVQDAMTHSVQDQLKGMSFLGKSVMEMAGTMKDVAETLESTEDLLKDFNDGLDEVGKATLDEIKTKKDFIKFYSKLQHHMSLDTEKSAKIQELIDKGKIDSAKELIQQEIDNAKVIRDTTADTASRLNIVSRMASGVSESFKKITEATGMGFLGQMATLGGSIGLIGLGVKQAYTELWNVGNAGLGGAYGLLGAKVKSSSQELGISVDAFAKNFQKNANIASTMGFDKFVGVIKENQHGLMTLGLSQEEAAKAASEFTQNARLSGVNTRDTDAVNKSIREQRAAFEKMRATTGVTIDEYNAQNRSLIESNVLQTSLVRLGKTQRQNVLSEIIATRERLRVMGMSNEQQIEFIKTMKANANQSVSDRYKDAGELMTAFSSIGMGDQGMRAVELLLTKQTNSPEFIELIKTLQSGHNQLQGSGNMSLENLSDFSTSILGKYGKHQYDAADINKPNVQTAEEMKNAIDNGQISKEVVDAKIAIGRAIQELNAPIVKIGAGMLGIAGLLLGQLAGNRLLGAILIALGKPGFGINTRGGRSRVPGSPTRRTPVSISRTPNGGYRDRSSGRMVSRTDAHARIQGQYWNPRATPAARPSLMSRLGSGMKTVGSATVATGKAGISAVGGLASAGLAATKSFGGKALGIAGKVAGASLKAVPFIGWAYMAGSAIYDGFKAVEQANEIFGTQAATTSQKIAAGIGGAVESLTFGLLPTEATAKFVDGTWTAAKDIGSSISAGIASLYTSVSDTAKNVMGFIKDRAQAFKSWAAGKWDTTKETAETSADRVGTIIRRGATVVREKYQEVTGNVPKFSDNVNGAINSAASKHGVDPKLMRTMAMIESTGNPNAVSSTNAKGLYQFVGGTAKQYGIRGNEFDASANADAAARLFKDNQKYLTKKGIEANGTNTYMAHQLGGWGATKLIRAAGSGANADPELRKQMDLNGGKGKSPAEFYKMWQDKYHKNYAMVNGVPGTEAATAVAAVGTPTIAKPAPMSNPTVAMIASSGQLSKEDIAAAQEKVKQGKSHEQAIAQTQPVQKPTKDKLDLLLDSINELVALTREQNSLAQVSMMEQRVANLQPSFAGSGPAAAAQNVG